MEEPYRVILAEVRDKLYNTREALQEVISGKRDASTPRTTPSSSPRNS